MAPRKKATSNENEKGKEENPPKYVVREKDIGEVHNTAALKMARDVANALNGLMKIPASVDYRKYKKEPKDRLERVLKYLTDLATAEPMVPAGPPDDSNKVIKESFKADMNAFIVERKGAGQIQQMLFEKHQADVKRSTIAAYITKYKKTSEFLKAAREWIEDIGDIRLYHKRGRLSELEELYVDAYRRYKTASTKPNADMCLKILEQARKEAMPIMNQITVNNANITQNIFTNILAKEEEQAIFERLPLHEIIIGKVAAKYRRDPYLLQRRLQNSYYANQAGANGMDKLDEPIEYPTAILYNVEDLGAKWKAIQAEEAKEVKESNVEETLTEDPSDIKLALLKKVEERKKKKANDEAGKKDDSKDEDK